MTTDTEPSEVEQARSEFETAQADLRRVQDAILAEDSTVSASDLLRAEAIENEKRDLFETARHVWGERRAARADRQRVERIAALRQLVLEYGDTDTTEILDAFERLTSELSEFVATVEARNAGFDQVRNELIALGGSEGGDLGQGLSLTPVSMHVRVGDVQFERFDTIRLVAELAARVLQDSSTLNGPRVQEITRAAGLAHADAHLSEVYGIERGTLVGESTQIRFRAARIAAGEAA